MTVSNAMKVIKSAIKRYLSLMSPLSDWKMMLQPII